jgi:hypothetical protein
MLSSDCTSSIEKGYREGVGFGDFLEHQQMNWDFVDLPYPEQRSASASMTDTSHQILRLRRVYLDSVGPISCYMIELNLQVEVREKLAPKFQTWHRVARLKL